MAERQEVQQGELVVHGRVSAPLQLGLTLPRAGRKQPDNREGDETCLAVLNNFYNDGIRCSLVSLHI